jgi:hypothetical protein
LSFRFDDLNSVGEPYTENYFRQLVGPSRRRQIFSAASASLKIMASAVLFERHPLERTVRWRTVANELSMGLVVRRYVSASLLAGDHPQAQKGMRVPAGDIETLVLDRLRAFFSSRTDIGDALTPLDLEARAFDAALRNAFTLSKRWLAMPPVEMKSLVLDIVERVTIAALGFSTSGNGRLLPESR